MRLDGYLGACGMATRSEAKKLIRLGAVTVDGVPARDPAMHVGSGQQVAVNGEPAVYREHVYVMMHKPEGVLSATVDRYGETAVDLLDGAFGSRELFPAGRLDRDATGLLLLTDDGALAHGLLSPKKHVDKVYEVLLDAPADEADIQAFAAGINLGDFVAKPAQLTPLDNCRAEVILTEGKFHEVKRLFEAKGKTVLKLHRRSIGPLVLDKDLQPGQWRELTAEEEEALKKH